VREVSAQGRRITERRTKGALLGEINLIQKRGIGQKARSQELILVKRMEIKSPTSQQSRGQSQSFVRRKLTKENSIRRFVTGDGSRIEVQTCKFQGTPNNLSFIRNGAVGKKRWPNKRGKKRRVIKMIPLKNAGVWRKREQQSK